ncbi:MAG: hypothetical protein M3460_04470 [Actinomycetota bacterium]|nr:hypothetical protein [Actinomycetota bacterium]
MQIFAPTPAPNTNTDDWARVADAALAAFTEFHQRLTKLDQELTRFQARIAAVAAELERDRRARRPRCSE